MKQYFFVFALLLMAVGMPFTVVSCSSDNDDYVDVVDRDIVGKWELSGWTKDGAFTSYSRGYISFLSDKTLKGKGYLNQIEGHYTCHGNKIAIDDYVTTKIGYTNQEDYFFEENLKNVTRYSFTNKGHLRLYYSGNDYFDLIIKRD